MNIFHKKSLALLFLIVGLSGPSTLCGKPAPAAGVGPTAGPQSSTLASVKIVDPHEASNIHVTLAKDLGFFKTHGIDADVSYTSAGKLAMDAVNGNGVQYGVVVDMNVAQTLYRSDDVVVLCEISESAGSIKLLARVDHGIKTAADLKGKKIAVLFGVNIHVFLDKYLKGKGIKGEVELVNLQPPQAAAALRTGAVDAAILWQPTVYKLQKELGDRLITLTDDPTNYWSYKMLLAAKRSYFEKHKDEARRMVESLVEADDYIRSHPDDAQAFLAKHLELELDAVRGFYKENHYEVRLTQRLLDMMSEEVLWLPKNIPLSFEGRDPVTTDFRSLIPDTLTHVKPAAVLINPR